MSTTDGRRRRGGNKKKEIKQPVLEDEAKPVTDVSTLSLKSEATAKTIDNNASFSPPSSSNSSTSSKIKEIALYVPKGRKILNEMKQKNLKSEASVNCKVASDIPDTCTRTGSDISDISEGRKGTTDASDKVEGKNILDAGECEQIKPHNVESALSSSTKKLTIEDKSYVPRIADDEFFFGRISDDELLLCCFTVKGIPRDFNENSKNSLTNFFLERGGSASWLPSGECILVFKNEALANSALASWNKSSMLYRAHRFNSLTDCREDFLKGIFYLFIRIV